MSETSTTRRVRKSPDERRTEMADAARAIALADGLDAVTLRAIAGRMGVASGLVAHYAPSMDELVADTFGDLVAEELRDVERLVAAVASAPKRIGILLETLLDGSRDDITRVWVQAWGMGVRNDALAARVRTEMDRWQTAIAAEVRRGMEAGDFTPGDAAAIAWHILAMVDGLNAHSLVHWNSGPGRRTLAARAVAGLLGTDPAALS